MIEYDGCSEPKMREIERQFFEQHKIKIDLKVEIAGVRLPLPTESDLKWAKRTYKAGQNTQIALFESAVKEQKTWRIAFALQIPYHYKFMKKSGLSSHDKGTAITDAIKKGSHENLTLILASKPAMAGHDKEHHVNLATPAQLKILTQFHPKEYQVENDWYSTMRAAIDSGSLEKVQILYKNGGDIFTKSDSRIELALKKQKPEIARFIKSEIAKRMQEAELDDSVDETRALPAPEKNRNAWERIADDEIAKHRIFDDGQQQISDVFNFSSQQVTHLHMHLGQKTSNMSIQNFADIPNQSHIATAAEELTRLGGCPNIQLSDIDITKPTHKLQIAPRR